ncbi:hypothetical protein EMIT0P74_30146 [Pseudomonas sp. IT-P74]
MARCTQAREQLASNKTLSTCQ